MKRLIAIAALTSTIFITGFNFIDRPSKILIEFNPIENTEGYMIKDNKLYISEDALKRDFGFSIFHDTVPEVQIRIDDSPKIRYRAKASLFEEFGDVYSPCSPEEAVKLWGEGVRHRNGAFQYIAYGKNLKERFKELFGDSAWVTGGSSPWILGYEVKKIGKDGSLIKYEVTFNESDSTGGKYTQTSELSVGKEDGKWRIVDIKGDFSLY